MQKGQEGGEKWAKLLSPPIEPVAVWSKGLWSCGHTKHSMQVPTLGKSRQRLMVIIILNDAVLMMTMMAMMMIMMASPLIQNLVCIQNMFLPSKRQRKWVAKRRWKPRQCQCRCRRCGRRGRGWSHQRRRRGSPWGRSPATEGGWGKYHLQMDLEPWCY